MPKDEKVTVEIKPGIRAADLSVYDGYTFSFFIHRAYSEDEQKQLNDALVRMRQADLGNHPDYHAPSSISKNYTVTVNTNPAPGQVFFGNFSWFSFSTQYNYIINNNGDSVYYFTGAWGDDWKLNHNNYPTDYNKDYGYEVFDSNYLRIANYFAVNGYASDNHEFQIFPDGHYFVIADDPEIVNMKVYNQDYQPNATVVGNVIQEFDSASNLIFEWRTFDHIIPTEAPHEDLAAGYIDDIHMNALEQDMDGNLLVSCRHLDQVFKLDLSTGNFIWRLGGDSNQFKFTNDPAQFDYQHDIRRLTNGDITIFDNNNWGTPNTSYAKEYKLDEVKKRATLVWSYTLPPVDGIPMASDAMGSIQRFDNGNTLIDWGTIPFKEGFPNMTEVDKNNNIVWELQYKTNDWNVFYRGHRYNWNPCARPSDSKLTTTGITSTSATLNWNSATGVAKYFIEYRPQGTSTWKTKKVAASAVSLALKSLLPSTTYEWNMQTWCDVKGNTKSGFTAIKTFTTTSQKSQPEYSSSQEVLQVYPNPSSQQATIRWNQESDHYQQCTIELWDLSGRLVLVKNFVSAPGTSEITLDVHTLNPGVYMVRLISESSMRVTTMEKQ